MESALLTPWLDDGDVQLYHGDCREILPLLAAANCIVTDPPYGETSLSWDRRVSGWLNLAQLKPGASAWIFGSLRSLTETAPEREGWKLAQDIVWEKHNGSSFHADRFRRVHELAIHVYQGQWADVYRSVQTTNDAVARTVHRKKERPQHTGERGDSSYLSVDGGPRLQRSVIKVRSEHGRAVNETQKPLGILRPLIAYSCPVGGVVLDPFCGSGSTLIAARELGMRAIGIEMRESQLEEVAHRLRSRSLFSTEASTPADPAPNERGPKSASSSSSHPSS